MSQFLQIVALAARLREEDANRWPLKRYLRQARAIVMSEVEA